MEPKYHPEGVYVWDNCLGNLFNDLWGLCLFFWGEPKVRVSGFAENSLNILIFI